ncbi:MAG: hypothetical protein NC114_06650 [Ruminococcus flavefaciens]|nr:hypothetical protein [Ruminococcus flavefaciens]
MAIKRYKLQYNSAGQLDTIYLETCGKSVILEDGTNVQLTLDSHSSSITSLSSKTTALTNSMNELSASVDGASALLDNLNGEVI